MMPASAKAHDSHQDPRILVHSIVANRAPAAEVMLRGSVRPEANDEVQCRYAAAAMADLGWRPVIGQFALFKVSIEGVTYIGHTEDSAQHVARWPAGVEYPRARLTPTSLGRPELVGRLLVQNRRTGGHDFNSVSLSAV